MIYILNKKYPKVPKGPKKEIASYTIGSSDFTTLSDLAKKLKDIDRKHKYDEIYASILCDCHYNYYNSAEISISVYNRPRGNTND
jgi:hypothetical protein